ncbi:hypothetical protein D5F11_012220 [Siminovitchia terrae]|uniref:Uncharacterized protein n=1 Tax=Siminovitchia terrae TaxID=1914933 RepID=A0A429X7E6_SIMTE|nr:hypothetical protein [Siminovitchia terrae]RST59356.1 hypothetical protein D5F11_012220 [Siminovitchia terrae]
MTLVISLLITLFIGAIVLFIYGREDIGWLKVPLPILLTGDFLLLLAKFSTGDPFLAMLLSFLIMVMLIFPVSWLLIIFIKSMKEKVSNRKLLAIAFSLVITFSLFFIPAIKKENQFEPYRNDFYAVANAIFEAYDEGKVSIGNQYHSPSYSTNDLEELESLFPGNIIQTMDRLNKSAGVHTYIVADKDVIYFSYGAVFQSISGIAICRNDKDPSSDETLRSRFFDGAIQYEDLGKGAYLFSDGL